MKALCYKGQGPILILLFVLFTTTSAQAWDAPPMGEMECKGSCFAPEPQENTPGWGNDQINEPIREDPAITSYNIGIKFQNQNRCADAIAYYRRAIRHNPRYGKAYNNLGYCLNKLGRTSEAMEAFRLAVRYGGSEHARKNLYNLEHRMNYNQAVDNHRRAWKLSDKGRFEEAIALEKENLRMYPGAYAHAALGYMFHQKGDLQKALDHYRKALRMEPGNADARKSLDDLLAEIENEKLAGRVKTRLPGMMDQLADKVEQNTHTDEASGSGLDFVVAEIPKGAKKEAVSSSETLSPSEKYNSLKTREIPSPHGYMSESEHQARRKRLTQLNETDLEGKLRNTERLLRQMQGEFTQNVEAIKAWVREAQDAEETALKESFKLIAGASLKIKNFDADKLKKIKSLSEKGLKVLDYGETAQNYAAAPSSRQANLEAAHLYLKTLHNILKSDPAALTQEPLITAHTEGFMKNADVLDITGLAGFIADYGYEAARWAVSYNQINSIIEGIDNPEGQLKAQMALKSYHEDLIHEKNRRKRKQ